MAKIQTLIGGASGKLGGSVFAKGLDGKTIGRIYQPKVSNPRTAGQVSQRSKVNLMGQLSALFDKNAIVTMGMGIPMKNRMEFNSRLLKAVSVTNSGNTQAHLNFGDIQFSKGAAVVRGTAVVNAYAENGVVNVTINQSTLDENYAERVFLVLMKGDAGEGYSCGMFKDVVFESQGDTVVEFDLPQNLVTGMNIAVYRVPIDLTAEGARVVYEAIRSGASADIVAEVISSSAYVRSFGKTGFVGVEEYDAEIAVRVVTPLSHSGIESGVNYVFAVFGKNLANGDLRMTAKVSDSMGGSPVETPDVPMVLIDGGQGKFTFTFDGTEEPQVIGKNLYAMEIEDRNTSEVVWRNQ